MTDLYSPQSYRTCVAPGQRTVVNAVIANAGDYLVPVPFRGRLVHFQTNTVVAYGAGGDLTLNLEKDAASGTVLGAATIATASSAIGVEDIGVLTAGLTDGDFTVDNQDICLAVTGSSSTGMANVFMVFEHAYVQ